MSGTSSVPPDIPTESTAAEDAQRRRRLRLVLIVGVGLVAVAAVALVARALLPASTTSPVSTSTATSTAVETSLSTPTVGPTTPPATSGAEASPVPRPTDCEQLYSPAMMASFGDLALNPTWATDPGADPLYGTDDAELRAVIDANENLTCIWASPVGPSGTGLITQVIWVSAAENGDVQARLNALGMDCYPESGGVRCVTSTSSDGETSGESHFLRDDVWVATKWTNVAPVGYTADVIDHLWPEG